MALHNFTGSDDPQANGSARAANLPVCPACGTKGSLTPKSKEITEKRRVKFGIFFILLSLIGGLGVLLWLITPRKTQVISVDRWNECSACGAQTR